MADDPTLAAAVDRLTTAVEQLTATIAAGQQPPVVDEPCIRCDGRGSWAPGVPCSSCGGTGRAPGNEQR